MRHLLETARILTLAVLMLLPSAAFAQNAVPQRDKAWNFAGALYLFASSIDSTTTVGKVSLDSELAFSQLFDNLESGVSLHFEALSNQRIGVAVDYVNIHLNAEDIMTPAPTATIETIDYRIETFEFFGYYRLGAADEGAGAFDLIGGTRYRKLQNDVSITGLPMPVTGGFDASWWDGLFGVRWSRRVHPRLGLVARVDGGSDTFNFQGGVGIQLYKSLYALIEYKYVNVDHTQGMGRDLFGYDAVEQGPLIGFGFMF